MKISLVLACSLCLLLPQASQAWWPFGSSAKKAETKRKVSSSQKQSGILQEQVNRVNQLRQNIKQHRNVLHALGRMPEHTYLTSVIISGDTVRLVGLAKTNANVSTLMRMLEKEDTLSSPRLQVISNTVISGVPVKKFTMTVSIAPYPVPFDRALLDKKFTSIIFKDIIIGESRYEPVGIDKTTAKKEEVTTSSLLYRAIPNYTEIPNALTDISQAGLTSGVEFRLIKPQQGSPGYWFYTAPLTIKVQGNYPAFLRFIDKLSVQHRVVTIENLHIRKAGQKTKHGVEAQLTLKLYRQAKPDEKLLAPRPVINTTPRDKIRQIVSARATRNPFATPSIKKITRAAARSLIPLCQTRLGRERLDNLSYVGRLQQRNRVYALIQSSQGSIHRVQVGDCLGLRAVIDRITPEALIVRQDIEKSTGWQRYSRRIKLKH